MSTTIIGVNGVGEAFDSFGEGIGILHGNFHSYGIFGGVGDGVFEVNDFVKSFFVAVEVDKKRLDAGFKIEIGFFSGIFLEMEKDAGDEIGSFSKFVFDAFVVELSRLFEDSSIGLETSEGSGIRD